MLFFSIVLIFSFIAVSEQQGRNANYEKHDPHIENSERILHRTERNPDYDQRINRTKQTDSKIYDAPCSEPRSIYETLGYQANPEAPNFLNQWKPIIPILDEEDRTIYDPRVFQHQQKYIKNLPHKQVSQSVLTQSPQKITGTTIVKVPEKNKKHNTEKVPIPMVPIDYFHVYKPIENNSSNSEHRKKPIPKGHLESITESSPPSKDFPGYDYEYSGATIKHPKQPFQVEHLESKTELGPVSKELPDHIPKHKHKEVVPHYFEFTTVKLSEVNQHSDKDEDEPIETYISERRALTEIEDKLPAFDYKYKKAKIETTPTIEVLGPEIEPSHKPEELLEYILKHYHNEAVTTDLGISTVKSLGEKKIDEKIPEHVSETEIGHAPEDSQEYILRHNHDEAVTYYFERSTFKTSEDDNKTNKRTNINKDKEESTEPYFLERSASSQTDVDQPMSDKIPESNLIHNNITKIKEQPIHVDYLESETEFSHELEELPEYIVSHNHNEKVTYHSESSTVNSEIDKEITKHALSIKNEKSTEPDISEIRAYFDIENKFPHDIYNYNKKNKIKPEKKAVHTSDYLETKTEPNPTLEELPKYILKHNHYEAPRYNFEIYTTNTSKINKKSNEHTHNVKGKEETTGPFLSGRKDLYDIYPKSNNPAHITKNKEESTESYASKSQVQILNETDYGSKTQSDIEHDLKHKHSTTVATDACILTEDLLSQESRRSMSPDKEPLATINDQHKLHENPQKDSNEVNTDKDDNDDYRSGSRAQSRAYFLPIQNTFPEPRILVKPTYHLLDPTKGAGISPLSDPKTLMMESTKVCYACSTLNDANCWFPDRTTTVKYCRPGYDLCVTKIYKSVSTIGKIVIRDCNSACDVNTPGLDTHYDSCAICKDDLCNNLPVENSASVISSSNMLSILVVSGIIKFMY